VIPRAALALCAVAGLAGCRAERALPDVIAATVYPARLAPWPPAPWTGAIGRGPAPSPLVPVRVQAAAPLVPLAAGVLWAVPGAGPARAVASGVVAGAPAIELIDVDDGAVRWRSDGCPSLVHVAAGAVVCAAPGGDGLVGLGLDDGAERWRVEGTFAAATGDLVVTAIGGVATVVDASGGGEAARFDLPAGVTAADVVGACRRDATVDVWTWSAAGLVRLDVRGRVAVPAWTAAVPRTSGSRTSVELCDDLVVLVRDAGDGSDALTVHAVARRDGRVVGGPLVARGLWGARGGEGLGVELATDAGIERRGRDLGSPVPVVAARAGRLIAERGASRLVEAAGGFLLLHGTGDGAAPLPAPPGAAAVLGDRHLLVAAGGAIRRWRLPTAPAQVAAVADPDERAIAHLADLPEPLAIEPAALLALPSAGSQGVAAVAVDPAEPAWIYAAPRETTGTGLAALDARTRQWRWHTPDGCPAVSGPVAIAVSGERVLCAAGSAVRAVARADGAAGWTFTAAGAIDTLAGAAGAVVVTVDDQAVVLDAASGAELARFADDRGGAPALAMIAVAGEPLVVTAERGGVVARAPRLGSLPRWALRVDGAVASVTAAGDRIAVALAGGELYLVDAATGTVVVAAAGYATAWAAPGGGALVVREERSAGWFLAAYDRDGVARFRTGLAGDAPWQLSPSRGHDPRAPLVVTDGVSGERAAAIDPATGVVTRAAMTGAASRATGLAFGTAIDGAAVAGVVLAQPLAIALF
jgi:hypothetical protein